MIVVTTGSDFRATFRKMDEDLGSLAFTDSGNAVLITLDLRAQEELRQTVAELTNAISIMRKEING